MYDDLSDEQKGILNAEQSAIINSNKPNIIVSASPGCGKTYTLIEKIKRDSAIVNKNVGFVACSFTREASRQLEKKLTHIIDMTFSFVGTIDAFVLSIIINPFKNRCTRKLYNHSTSYRDLSVYMPSLGAKSNEITRTGKSHPEVNSYFDEWIRNFKSGKYEISYCSYMLASLMIREMPEVRGFISSRFFGIYVDEAQDLNEFQHDFISVLRTICGLKTFLIGDKNQSIYEFRGARPALFSSLINSGYTNFTISISVRCHKSIMDFANRFLVDSSITLLNNEIKVHVYDDYTSSDLDSILSETGSMLWLTDTNDLAADFSSYSSRKSFNFVYTRQLQFNDEEFSGTYLTLVEELLMFYFFLRDPSSTQPYSVELVQSMLEDYITEKKYKTIKNILLDVSVGPFEYITTIFKSMDIIIGDSANTELKTQLSDLMISQHYNRKIQNQKRIMTIHGSKGLEADTVIVFIDYDEYNYNMHPQEREARFRRYYVAFSRAKKELFVFFRSSRIDTYGRKRFIDHTIMKNKVHTALSRLSVE